MIPLPKPRGFWDYSLFALLIAGLLLLLFWMDASDGVGWSDAGLALAAAASCVFAIILARRRGRAAWIVRPTWYAYLLSVLGVSTLMVGAPFADAYLLHRSDITSSQILHDIVVSLLSTAGLLWFLRKQSLARRQSS